MSEKFSKPKIFTNDFPITISQNHKLPNIHIELHKDYRSFRILFS